MHMTFGQKSLAHVIQRKKKKRKNSNSCYFGEIYHLFDINFKIAQINTFKYNL